MKPLAAALLAALLLTPFDLSTVYREGGTFRVVRETKVEMESTSFSMEVDGRPVEREGPEGGSSSSQIVVFVDEIQALTDDRPSEVRRTFETLSGDVERFGQELSLDAPLAGAVLLLTSEDGEEADAEVVEGGPVDDEALEGHAIGLELDALLPDGELGDGGTWDVDGDDLRRALGMTVARALFSPPEFDFGGGGRRGGGGGRGPRGPRGGAGEARLFEALEWDVQAELTDEEEEIDGLPCRVIALTGGGSGSIEMEPGRGFGRGRSLEPGVLSSRLGTDVDAELEARLYVAREDPYPVRLETRIVLTVDTENEFDRRGTAMRMERTQEGVFEQTVEVERN